MPELLRARRFPVRWRLAISNKQVERIEGHTINVSSSGILFASGHRFRVGDVLALDIDIPDSIIVQATLRVVREAPAPVGMVGHAGRFTAISEPHRRVLAEALVSVRREESGEECGRAGPLA
jgi:hypothetical protein